MSLTILSTQSKAIQKLIKEQMRQETEELGFDPYGDSGQEEFERRVMDLEQQSLEHPEIDWEVKYWELDGTFNLPKARIHSLDGCPEEFL